MKKDLEIDMIKSTIFRQMQAQKDEHLVRHVLRRAE